MNISKLPKIIIINQQLGGKLGRGAFGAVYKGLDLKTGQFVALKRIGLQKVDEERMMVM